MILLAHHLSFPLPPSLPPPPKKRRDEHEKVKAQLDQVAELNRRYQENADRTQETIASQMGAILDASAQRDEAILENSNTAVELQRLEREVASLKIEKATIQKEKDAAVKEAEDAHTQAKALASYASGK